MYRSLFALTALLTAISPAAMASSPNKAASTITECFFKDEPQLGKVFLEISEEGTNGLLPQGIYVHIIGDGIFGESTLFRVKPAGEAAVKEIVARMLARDLHTKNSGEYTNISFAGIELSAISVDVNTTSDLRGEHILLIKNDNTRVGDSFFSAGDRIGKFAQRNLENCQ